MFVCTCVCECVGVCLRAYNCECKHTCDLMFEFVSSLLHACIRARVLACVCTCVRVFVSGCVRVGVYESVSAC